MGGRAVAVWAFPSRENYESRRIVFVAVASGTENNCFVSDG